MLPAWKLYKEKNEEDQKVRPKKDSPAPFFLLEFTHSQEWQIDGLKTRETPDLLGIVILGISVGFVTASILGKYHADIRWANESHRGTMFSNHLYHLNTYVNYLSKLAWPRWGHLQCTSTLPYPGLGYAVIPWLQVLPSVPKLLSRIMTLIKRSLFFG